MLALGLASVPFFDTLYEKLTVTPINLPQVKSSSPIYVHILPELSEPEETIQYSDFVYESSVDSLNRIIQNRDLSNYEYGGRISNCRVEDSEPRKCEANTYKGRNFILNHWKAKKRGYIIYEWSGTDTGNDFYYFIEPDESGNWHVLKRSERLYTRVYRGRIFTIESLDIHTVKNKLKTEDNYDPTPGTHHLVFFDNDGKQIGTL